MNAWMFDRSRLEVCGPCGDVVGRLQRHPSEPTLIQHGRCPEHQRPPDATPWPPNFDIGRAVELCRCCGRIPLRSGSRWSVWVCGACKRRIGQLHAHHDRYIVPIGRHSLHGGFMLQGEAALDPVAVELFAETWTSVRAAMDVLAEWAQEVVRRNLSDLGMDPREAVPLRTYVDAAIAGIDPEARFEALCRYPDQRRTA